MKRLPIKPTGGISAFSCGFGAFTMRAYTIFWEKLYLFLKKSVFFEIQQARFFGSGELEINC